MKYKSEKKSSSARSAAEMPGEGTLFPRHGGPGHLAVIGL